MSGGSFNYLCFCECDDIINRRQDLTDMADELTSRGYEDAALATEEVIELISRVRRQLEVRITQLAPVWKSVEWTCSGDTSDDSIAEAIDKYRSIE